MHNIPGVRRDEHPFFCRLFTLFSAWFSQLDVDFHNEPWFSHQEDSIQGIAQTNALDYNRRESEFTIRHQTKGELTGTAMDLNFPRLRPGSRAG